jgi:hypothetical protein
VNFLRIAAFSLKISGSSWHVHCSSFFGVSPIEGGSMKSCKLVAAALALLACPLAAHAEDGKFAIGAQGGITFPDFHVKDQTLNQIYGNKNGWLGGIYLEFGLWSITLRPELNYVEKGYTVANTAEVKNQYLEVPVLLKISPLGQAAFSPFLVIGPQWSKQIGETVTTLGTTTA